MFSRSNYPENPDPDEISLKNSSLLGGQAHTVATQLLPPSPISVPLDPIYQNYTPRRLFSYPPKNGLPIAFFQMHDSFLFCCGRPLPSGDSSPWERFQALYDSLEKRITISLYKPLDSNEKNYSYEQRVILCQHTDDEPFILSTLFELTTNYASEGWSELLDGSWRQMENSDSFTVEKIGSSPMIGYTPRRVLPSVNAQELFDQSFNHFRVRLLNKSYEIFTREYPHLASRYTQADFACHSDPWEKVGGFDCITLRFLPIRTSLITLDGDRDFQYSSSVPTDRHCYKLRLFLQAKNPERGDITYTSAESFDSFWSLSEFQLIGPGLFGFREKYHCHCPGRENRDLRSFLEEGSPFVHLLTELHNRAVSGQNESQSGRFFARLPALRRDANFWEFFLQFKPISSSFYSVYLAACRSLLRESKS